MTGTESPLRLSQVGKANSKIPTEADLSPSGKLVFVGHTYSGAIISDTERDFEHAHIIYVAAFAAKSEDVSVDLIAGHDTAPEPAEFPAIGVREGEQVHVVGGLAPWQMLRVAAVVEARLRERLTMAKLAFSVKLSESQFTRSFRRSFGEPPHAYLMRRRIERAKYLMRSGTQALADIALACGFSDQAHLSRLFRKFEGETPGIWRRKSALRNSPAHDSIRITVTTRVANGRR